MADRDWADEKAWGLAMNWLQEKRPTTQGMLDELSAQFAAELRQARAEGRRDTELAKVVSEYLAELDNPAPDWAMRQILRQRMRRALTAGPRKAGEEGDAK